MNRRSLTIVEVLIAVALLVSIAAIVTPYVVDSLDERAFESAADTTGEQLMLARAHAQATGQSVEVRYRPDESCIEARFFVPWMGRWETPSEIGHSQSPYTPSIDHDARTDEQLSRSIITEPWANRSISKSVRIATRQPIGEDDVELARGLTAADAAAIEAELTNTDDVRLAVFMPDGSALIGDPFWFKDSDGRMGKLTVNPFSGLPLWERLMNLTSSSADQYQDADAFSDADSKNGDAGGADQGETATWRDGELNQP